MEPLTPPGKTSTVQAGRVLVVAPHYDDEVLGCGGLLAILAASGSSIRILFLSDGSGGREEVGDRAAYAERRRSESEAALEALEIGDARHLGLPDGGLDQHREVIREALGEELAALRPELLLVPSPLELTADHRAAFAAVHDLLGGWREQQEGKSEPLVDLQVLLYEVNHPAYPDLLVDVGDQLGRIEEAMQAYRSQQERHDYLSAALGLRRYRTLSLEPGVEAAEGYRLLGLEDFVTRSPAQLVSHLGGVPQLLTVEEGPLVSVVVRTKDRPELLAEALESLVASSYRRLEVVLVNDGGVEPSLPEQFPFPLVEVRHEKSRGRAVAAEAGVEAASGAYVAFLDDDDLYAPEHIATLVQAVQAADVEVVYSDAAVGVYELGEGRGWTCVERRLPYSRSFDPDLLLVDNYIPFNTLLVERGLFGRVGGFDDDFPFLEDWEFLIRLSRAVAFHHLPRVTCEYRHFRGAAASHVLAGSARERRGFDAEFLGVKARVLAKHRALVTPELLSAVIDRLRYELVVAHEEAVSQRRLRRRLEGEAGEREAEFHRLHGEVVALRSEHERLSESLKRQGADLAERDERIVAHDRELRARAGHIEDQKKELQRLYDTEMELRAKIDEQTEHLGRTYAEIERLNQLLGDYDKVLHDYEQMRGVRLQRRVERLLGRGS